MKKVIVFCVCVLVMLSGCGKRETAAEAIQARYSAARAGSMEAEIVYHLPKESRTFTVRSLWDRKETTTTILAPEEVADLSAKVSKEGLAVSYDGAAVSVGEELQELSPASCVSRFLQAVAEGYILETGEESVDDLACLRVTFDTESADGGSLLCTVWFEKENGTPYYIEFSQDGTVMLTLRTLSFELEGEEE